MAMCAGVVVALAGWVAADAPAEPVASTSGEQALTQRYTQDVQPLLQQFCYPCHGDGEHSGGVRLDPAFSLQVVQAQRDTWDAAALALQDRFMPPRDQPQPSQQQIETVTGWIADVLGHADCSGPRDPGRVGPRRLNRNEYNHTIRDLVGVDFQPADDFPADDTGYGFDNVADVLTMSPLLVEKYLAAAEQVMARALVTDPPVERTTWRIAGAELQATVGATMGSAWLLWSRGEAVLVHDFPVGGTYEVRILAAGDKAGDELPRMEVRVEGQPVETFDIPAPRGEPETYTVRVEVKAGRRPIAAAFTNDFYEPEHPDPKRRDRNLIVEEMAIDGPIDYEPPPLPESHRRIFFVMPGDRVMPAGPVTEEYLPATPELKDAAEPLTDEQAARLIVGHFAARAFRRPVAEEEVDRLLGLYQQARQIGDSFEQGVQLALTAALVSPHFLFRIEQDQYPDDPDRAHLIGEHELATRLSYFLWSSMPDDELFTLAQAGRLREPGALEQQVKRMLADPKAEAFVRHFPGQWLELRSLQAVTPDPAHFPAFNDALRQGMRRETELFFRALIEEDRSALELIDSDFTFLNEALAKHYGIEGVTGEQFQRVSLADSPRGGVLTMASVLTVTSNPTRTSPVKRGQWVLEQLLGTPAPPPPPDAPTLSDAPEHAAAGSLRQRLEVHRNDPNCAVCHERMDPIGFALEHFDGVGAWRAADGDYGIDASGTLPSGESFDGVDGLKQVLLQRQDQVVRHLVERMMVYALGRGIEPFDACAVDEVCMMVQANDHRLSSVVLGIVKSDPFQKRRAARVPSHSPK